MTTTRPPIPAATSPWTVRDHLPEPDFILQSHRGAGDLAPENTLASFQLAWSLHTWPEADLRTTQRASAAAVGLTGIIGYASTIITGFGIGWIADHYHWTGVFGMMLVCTAATLLLMATTWNVGAHPELPEPADETDPASVSVAK